MTLEDGIALIVIANPPVNVLSHGVRLGLDNCLCEAIADPTVTAVAILGAGKTFPAGADISEFGAPFVPPVLAAIHDRIESSRKPVIAVMHGTSLGGGLEIAMACHVRIAHVGARFGLPEVRLGLFPGGGGTQRLARLAGPDIALDLILSGRQFDASEALRWGIVDAVFDGEPRAAAIRIALGEAFKDLRRVRDMTCRPHEPHHFARYRKELEEHAKGQLAPFIIVQCIEYACTKPFEEARRLERGLTEQLLASSQHRALKHLFFAEREALKPPLSRPLTRPAPEELTIVKDGSDFLCSLNGNANSRSIVLHAVRPVARTRLIEIIHDVDDDASLIYLAAECVRQWGSRPVFIRGESVADKLLTALLGHIHALLAAGSSRQACLAALARVGFDTDMIRDREMALSLTRDEDESWDGVALGEWPIVESCLTALSDEAARMLEAGKVFRAGDLDVICVEANGFPRHLGGPAFRRSA